jgi:hypothetical protein
MDDVTNPTEKPVVTVLSDRSALEPKLSEDAACVASAATAAMRPDRLLVAFVTLLLLWCSGMLWDSVRHAGLPAQTGEGAEMVLRELVRGLPEEKRPEGWETDSIDGRDIELLFAEEGPGVRAMAEQHRSRGAFEYLTGSMAAGASASLEGMLAFEPEATLGGLFVGGVRPIRTLWAADRGFLVVYGSWALLVLGVLGAAMCRSDAERLGKDREVPLLTAAKWAAGDWRRLWGVGMLPPVMTVLLFMPIALVLGLLSLVPGLDVLVAITWFAPLVLGFAAAIVLAAWLIGLPLIIPAASLESGDPAEITVRVATLIRRRPLRVFLLSATAIVTGLLAWLAIAMVVVIMLAGSAGALSAIVEPIAPIATPSWPTLEVESIVETEVSSTGVEPEWGPTRLLSVRMIEWWNQVVIMVAQAWILGFTLLAASRIYLCLRRLVEKLPFHDLGQPGPLG